MSSDGGVFRWKSPYVNEPLPASKESTRSSSGDAQSIYSEQKRQLAQQGKEENIEQLESRSEAGKELECTCAQEDGGRLESPQVDTPKSNVSSRSKDSQKPNGKHKSDISKLNGSPENDTVKSNGTPKSSNTSKGNGNVKTNDMVKRNSTPKSSDTHKSSSKGNGIVTRSGTPKSSISYKSDATIKNSGALKSNGSLKTSESHKSNGSLNINDMVQGNSKPKGNGTLKSRIKDLNKDSPGGNYCNCVPITKK